MHESDLNFYNFVDNFQVDILLGTLHFRIYVIHASLRMESKNK